MTKQIKQQPTTAWLKADEQRTALNDGREKLVADDYSSVVFLFNDTKGRPCAIGYRGRSTKPEFRLYYKNQKTRHDSVTAWMQGVTERNETAKKANIRQLEIGDVLCSSWGYEQTNIDYYLVTALVGKKMVEIREIGKKQILSDGWASGTCCPDTAKVIGEPMRKVVQGHYVTINGHIAEREEYMIVDGERVYRQREWSAYH